MTAGATRTQRVAVILRHAIRDGLYTCGERLVEFRIAQEMKVSQNTVRDALRLLEAEGWLVHRARQGVYVQAFTADQAEEIYALWAVIEQKTYEWALSRYTRTELLNELRQPLEQARDSFENGRWSLLRQAIFGWHTRLIACAGKPHTAETLSRLMNQAYLLEVDYELHQPLTQAERAERLAGYEHLLGMLKFADLPLVAPMIEQRILDDGRPIIRWLALHE